jgi:hypothetical protein
MEQIPPSEAVARLIKDFLAFCTIRSFISMFRGPYHQLAETYPHETAFTLLLRGLVLVL